MILSSLEVGTFLNRSKWLAFYYELTLISTGFFNWKDTKQILIIHATYILTTTASYKQSFVPKNKDHYTIFPFSKNFPT